MKFRGKPSTRKFVQRDWPIEILAQETPGLDNISYLPIVPVKISPDTLYLTSKIRHRYDLRSAISMMLFRTLRQITLINLTSTFHKLLCLFAHADGEGLFGFDALLFGVFADVLRYLHRAEMRSAH